MDHLPRSSAVLSLISGGHIPTSGHVYCRVAPTDDVAGVVCEPGTDLGSLLFVINESAYTVTFGSSAVSHVAEDVRPIAPYSALGLVWDGKVWSLPKPGIVDLGKDELLDRWRRSFE